MVRKKGKRHIRREVLPELDEALWHQLEEVWRKAEEGIQDAQRSKDGHQQGTKHCLAVEENVSALIPDEWKGDRLTAMDLFVLSAAAGLHDVGKAGDTLDDHGHVSMREVRARAQDFGLDEGQAEVVGWIVRAHNDGNLEALPPTPRFLGTAEVDVRTLAALFKLADMLHTEYRRVSRQMVDFGAARGEDNPKTLFRLRMRGWGYDPLGRILLQAVPKDVSDIEVVFTGFEMMRRELEPISTVLQAAGFPHEFAVPELDETDLRLAAEAERQAERAFVGMDFFREEDAPRFKGRKTDTEQLYGLILSAPVALLEGDSGVGKTSLIHAGLFPLLRKTGWRFASTRPFADPTANVVRDIGEQLLDGARPESIVAALEQVARRYKPGKVLIVLDQFEDVTRVPVQEMLDDLRRALVVIQARRFRNLHLLLAYRSDARAGVGPLFQTVAGSVRGLPYHPLQPLTREGARAALKAGFAEAHVGLDPKGRPNGTPILDVILDDIETQRRDFYPPYLQMVGETLCIAAQKTTDKIVTAALYSEKGGATKSIGEYLFNRLAEFGEREKSAKRVLVALVRSTGIRGQRSFEELQAEIKLDVESLTQLLRDLVDRRMIRHLSGDQYEIIHDYLAQLVVVSKEERQVKRLQELLAAKAAAYERTRVPLAPSEMAQLYLARQQIVPDGAEAQMLLHSNLLDRGPAWYWLKNMGHSWLVSSVRKALDSSVDKLQQRAIAILGQMGDRESIPILCDMLDCKSSEVQREAIRVLSIIGGLEVSPNIRRQLSAHDWTVRHAAALALGDIKDREASIDLKNALKDGSKRVRLAAASSLVKIDGRGALPNLVEMMYNTYWQRGNWQRQAASILAQITTHDDVPSFKAMCRHENFNAVAIAVEVLAYTIGAETIPFIREIMAQADWRVRPAVIRAFTVAANEDFLPELQIILETDRGYEARLAALALQRLGRRDAMPDLSTLVYRCFAPHEEEQTADVLTQIVTDEDFECLQEMLKDSHWYKRLAAIPAMAKIRGREAFPGLKNITDNGRAMEKRWAVKAMAPLADRSDWDYFFGLLENMDADIRATAACVIGRLGLERDLTPVAEMAMHHLSRGIYEGTAQALLILDRKLYCPFEWLGEIVEDDHV